MVMSLRDIKADQRDFIMMKVLKPLVDGIRCEAIRRCPYIERQETLNDDA